MKTCLFPVFCSRYSGVNSKIPEVRCFLFRFPYLLSNAFLSAPCRHLTVLHFYLSNLAFYSHFFRILRFFSQKYDRFYFYNFISYLKIHETYGFYKSQKYFWHNALIPDKICCFTVLNT